MYSPRDTHLQTRRLRQFRRRHYTEELGKLPPHIETAFNRVSYGKKRTKVNRPLQKIRLVDTKRKYALLRSYPFWAAVILFSMILWAIVGATVG